MTTGSTGLQPASGNDSGQELIKYLRNEAYQVRDCFTRYSIQILAVSAALIVAISRFDGIGTLGLLAVFPVLLLVQISGMGVHKYETSNRLLGFELHIQRITHLRTRNQLDELMANVGWEEAMKAWRLVQPTIWETIYEPKGWLGRVLIGFDKATRKIGFNLKLAKRLCGVDVKKDIADQINKCLDTRASDLDRFTGFWFDQNKAIEEMNARGVFYYAGGYLRNMMYTLSIAILFCLIVGAIGIFQMWAGTGTQFSAKILATAALIFVVLIVLAGQLNLYSRIRVLESGLLSIHSCAILWEATILAHLLALEKLQLLDPANDSIKTMNGYTRALALEAEGIKKNAPAIHSWVAEARRRLVDKIISPTEVAMQPPQNPGAQLQNENVQQLNTLNDGV